MGEERAAPRGLRVTERRGDDLRREAADRAAPAVDEPGLPGERLAVADHADDVAVALAQPTGCEHRDVRRVAVDLGDVLAQPARGRAGVEFGLDDEPTGDEVQPAGEAQHRATSALRQHGFVTGSRASSSLTAAVIAIDPLPCPFRARRCP